MKLVVINAPGVHLGYLGCYGADWVSTPNLDGLAASGVVFDQHFADRLDGAGPWNAWLSGRYSFPSTTGGMASPASPGDTAEADLLDLLARNGIATSLVTLSDNPPAERRARWQRVLACSSARDSDSDPFGGSLPALRKCLKALAGRESLFIWIEMQSLLPPWASVSEEGEDGDLQTREETGEAGTQDIESGPLPKLDDAVRLRVQLGYAARVGLMDEQVGLLMEEIERRLPTDQLLVVFTSEHGVTVGERDFAGLAPGLHEELVHLPLLVRYPGGANAGLRVAALTQAVDLMPTFLAAFGVAPPPVHGHDLTPLAREELDRIRPYACLAASSAESVYWALRSPSWALMLSEQRAEAASAGSGELYAKPDDRWELNNVAQHHPELVTQLERALREFVEATRRPRPLVYPSLDEAPAEAPPSEAQPGGQPSVLPPSK